jgi:hypothetical protein
MGERVRLRPSYSFPDVECSHFGLLYRYFPNLASGSYLCVDDGYACFYASKCNDAKQARRFILKR